MEKEDKIGLTLAYIGILILTLIGLASAETIIAGNNYTFQIETDVPLTWDVVGNSSNMDGFSVHQDGYNITFVTDYRFKPDQFTIILFDNSTREIITEVEITPDCPSCSGGGRRTIYKNNTIYKDRLIEVCPNGIVNRTITEPPDYSTCEPEPINWFWRTLGILFILSIIILLVKHIRKRKDRKN